MNDSPNIIISLLQIIIHYFLKVYNICPTIVVGIIVIIACVLFFKKGDKENKKSPTKNKEKNDNTWVILGAITLYIILSKGSQNKEMKKFAQVGAYAETVEQKVNTSSFDYTLGKLSEKYESNGDPGCIADTKGDPGGKSYGVWQLATNTGSLNKFLNWLKTKDKNIYNKLVNGNLDENWVAVADVDKEYFYDLQYIYIKEKYYDPVINDIPILANKSKTLKNVVWSTSVQHGVGGAKGIIRTQDLNSPDEQIIRGIYGERKKVNIYFYSCSQNVKNAVYNRFVEEENEAIEALKGE